MEPVRDARVTLVDLLDRILDKGLLINADLIISVAGVPLIGVKLNAAIASIETMLKYGIMMDWSETKKLREALDERTRLKLAEGERLVSRFFGSVHFAGGLYSSWRPCWIYVTDRRVLMVRKEPYEVLVEISNEEIESISTCADSDNNDVSGNLYLHLRTGESFKLRLSEASQMKTTIENMVNVHSGGPIPVRAGS
jgi:hypothetical protein